MGGNGRIVPAALDSSELTQVLVPWRRIGPVVSEWFVSSNAELLTSI